MQTGVPILATAPWPVSALIQAILWDLGGPRPPRPILFVIWLFGSPGWVDYWWYLVGRDSLSNHSFVGISTIQVLKLYRQIGTLEDPGMQTLHRSLSVHCCLQLGTWHRFCEHMDQHTVSFDTRIGMHPHCAKWWYGDFLHGVDQTYDIIKTEFPHLHGVTQREGMTSLLFHPCYPALLLSGKPSAWLFGFPAQ